MSDLNIQPPSRFEVSVGGYFGPSYTVRLVDGQLLYEYAEGHTSNETVAIVPSAQDWAKFWRSVAPLRIWEWEASYDCPTVLDGTGWEVEIQQGGRTLISTGSNAYPPDGRGPDESSEWRKFCRAVSNLVGKRPFK